MNEEAEIKKDGVTSFLCEEIPDIDDEVLEIYDVLEKEASGSLFVEHIDVCQEKLNFYAQKHFEIYSERAKALIENLPSSLVLSSGMFGGKTTFAFLLDDYLKEKGCRTEMLIADVMGEDYITARSYLKNQKRSATRFGLDTDYQKTIENLKNSDIEVIFLDEFSFLDTNVVEDLQEMCFEEDRKLILTGLNCNYLGEELPAFRQDSTILNNSLVEKCFSFVPNLCEDKPVGSNTIRYVKISNQWVLDAGLLPIVVSKENSHVVHYGSALYQQTPKGILEDSPEIFEKVLCPSNQRVVNQENLLKTLLQN